MENGSVQSKSSPEAQGALWLAKGKKGLSQMSICLFSVIIVFADFSFTLQLIDYSKHKPTNQATFVGARVFSLMQSCISYNTRQILAPWHLLSLFTFNSLTSIQSTKRRKKKKWFLKEWCLTLESFIIHVISHISRSSLHTCLFLICSHHLTIQASTTT